MNNKPKIFFIDLDGTLLDKMGHKTITSTLIDKISQENKDAIKEIQKNTPIIVSTGRPPRLVLPLIKELNIPYAVTQNGALIINDQGKVIRKEEMDYETAIKVVNFCKKHKLSIKLNGETTIYGIRKTTKFIIKHLGWKVEKKYDKLENNLSKNKMYQKFFIIGKLKYKMKRLCKKLGNDKLGLKISAVTSGAGYAIEVTSENATKGKANAFIANKLGFKNKDAAHIGDTMNDSTARGIMGHLIIMDNASKELKKMGTMIGPNYKNAGVAKILLKKDW